MAFLLILDYESVNKYLASFEVYERLIYWETSKDYTSLDKHLADPLLQDTITNALNNGFKANLLALDGKLQQSVKFFETALNELKKYPQVQTLRTIWEIMYWNVLYTLGKIYIYKFVTQIGQRNPAQDILTIVQMIDPQYARNVNQYKVIGDGAAHKFLTRWLCLNSE
jgi:hypothetical protein